MKILETVISNGPFTLADHDKIISQIHEVDNARTQLQQWFVDSHINNATFTELNEELIDQLEWFYGIVDYLVDEVA